MSACETQPDFREVKKLKASGALKKKKKENKPIQNYPQSFHSEKITVISASVLQNILP